MDALGEDIGGSLEASSTSGELASVSGVAVPEQDPDELLHSCGCGCGSLLPAWWLPSRSCPPEAAAAAARELLPSWGLRLPAEFEAEAVSDP